MAVAHAETLTKIVEVYFAAVTREPFFFREKLYRPRPLTVYPTVRRGWTCPAGCGACCFRFTLEWIPTEPHPATARAEWVEFNGRRVLMYRDRQEGNAGPFCRNLDRSTGRCGIYAERPLSCDFELTRFLHFQNGTTRLTTKQYGRAWNMTKIDGDKGAMCEILPPDQEWIDDLARRLRRLLAWTDHFGLETKVPMAIDYVLGGSNHPLTI